MDDDILGNFCGFLLFEHAKKGPTNEVFAFFATDQVRRLFFLLATLKSLRAWLALFGGAPGGKVLINSQHVLLFVVGVLFCLGGAS